MGLGNKRGAESVLESMAKRARNVTKRRARGFKRSKRSSNSLYPPAHTPGIVVTNKFRYYTSTSYTHAAPLQVKRSQLQAAIVLNTASTTANRCLIDNYKLKSVEMWDMQNGGASTEISLRMTSGYSDGILVSQYGVPGVKPGHIFMPVRSDISDFMWSGGQLGSDTLFEIVSNSNSLLIEVVMEFNIGGTGDGAQTLYTSTASGTVGTLYYTPLDGTAGAVLPEVAVLSIV